MRPVDLRVAVFLRLVALLALALARVVAFLPVERARLVTFLAPALARVVAFLPVERARLVTFLPVVRPRVVAFFPLAAAFFAEDRALRTPFFAAPRARVDTFFPVVSARFTAFLVSASAVPPISPAGSAIRSTVSHVRSGGGSADGAGGGAGSLGVSGAPPHGEVYPSLLGSSEHATPVQEVGAGRIAVAPSNQCVCEIGWRCHTGRLASDPTYSSMG